jgi:hypothetical protein
MGLERRAEAISGREPDAEEDVLGVAGGGGGGRGGRTGAAVFGRLSSMLADGVAWTRLLLVFSSRRGSASVSMLALSAPAIRMMAGAATT